VATFSHEQSAVIAWEFACRASTVKLDATDATDFILGHVPSPCGDGVPLVDLDLHVGVASSCSCSLTNVEDVVMVRLKV
jgi:hypothetical protein